MLDWKPMNKNGEYIGHDEQGRAMGRVVRHARGLIAYVAVSWPGGARDWLEVARTKVLTDAKAAVDARFNGEQRRRQR